MGFNLVFKGLMYTFPDYVKKISLRIICLAKILPVSPMIEIIVCEKF